MLRIYCVHERLFASEEELPEDGLVRSKHVAIKCDFNDILK
jgi:hypothetical protein